MRGVTARARAQELKRRILASGIPASARFTSDSTVQARARAAPRGTPSRAPLVPPCAQSYLVARGYDVQKAYDMWCGAAEYRRERAARLSTRPRRIAASPPAARVLLCAGSHDCDTVLENPPLKVIQVDAGTPHTQTPSAP